MSRRLGDGRRTRVLVVEESQVYRVGVCSLIGGAEDLLVVGEVDELSEAGRVCGTERPDVVLLEGSDPVAAERAVDVLLDTAPEVRVVLLCDSFREREVRRMMARGATAILARELCDTHLLPLLQLIGADSSRNLALSFSSETRVRSGNVLSGREREILDLVAEALTNAQIATRLSIKEGTVKRHMRNIFMKLNAQSRMDAVNKAVTVDLGRFPERTPDATDDRAYALHR